MNVNKKSTNGHEKSKSQLLPLFPVKITESTTTWDYNITHGVFKHSKSRSNWNLGVLVFVEGEKPENPEKNPRSKERTDNKLNPHETASMGIEPGSQRRGLIHCATHGPLNCIILSNDW